MNSYMSFYVFHNKKSWPIFIAILEKWIANQIFGSTFFKQNQIKPNTVFKYLSALNFYHIDRWFSLKSFYNSQIVLIIQERRRLFSNTK